MNAATRTRPFRLMSPKILIQQILVVVSDKKVSIFHALGESVQDTPFDSQADQLDDPIDRPWIEASNQTFKRGFCKYIIKWSQSNYVTGFYWRNGSMEYDLISMKVETPLLDPQRHIKIPRQPTHCTYLWKSKTKNKITKDSKVVLLLRLMLHSWPLPKS